jgi:hypothetical protein
MRRIEWARTYNWAVKFDSAPRPFNEWFPATSVNEAIFNVEKMDFNAGMGSFAVPKNTTMYELKISLVDGGAQEYQTDKYTLHNWIRQWGKDIVSLDTFVKTVQDPVVSRNCMVVYYDAVESYIQINSYKVFPYGNYSFNGTSDSGVMTLDLDFVITARGSKSDYVKGPIPGRPNIQAGIQPAINSVFTT